MLVIQNVRKIKSYFLPIGKYDFYENLVVSEYNEGITLDFEACRDLFFLIDRHFGDHKPYGILSNRVNSFSVIPTDYNLLKNHHYNMKAIAVVSNLENAKINVTIEQQFCPKPMDLFSNVPDAMDWLLKRVFDPSI